VHVTELPIADGGDGTISVLIAAGFDGEPVDTVDALLCATKSQVARQAATVVIELAEICGLAGVKDRPPRPWDTSTQGVGLAAHAALVGGAKELLLAVGGSASVDGGLGLLAGLGYGLFDANGDKVPPTAKGLARIWSITPPADERLLNSCTWTVLVDVDSPAFGPHGAAQVFGPQKGFTEDECFRLDTAMGRWCDIVSRFGGRFSVGELQQLPGAGAAGGFAVAASGVLGASIRSGAEVLAQLTNLAGAVAAADAVIIGEGRLDEQTLAGKGPAFVASIAKAAGKPVFALAGSSALNATQLLELGIKSELDVVTLAEAAGSVSAALANPRHWVTVACDALGGRLAASGL
jgi:glycerate kinase